MLHYMVSQQTYEIQGIILNLPSGSPADLGIEISSFFCDFSSYCNVLPDCTQFSKFTFGQFLQNIPKQTCLNYILQINTSSEGKKSI